MKKRKQEEVLYFFLYMEVMDGRKDCLSYESAFSSLVKQIC